jgi:hypothetical protein
MAFNGSLYRLIVLRYRDASSKVLVCFIERFVVRPNIIVFSQTEWRLQQTSFRLEPYVFFTEKRLQFQSGFF